MLFRVASYFICTALVFRKARGVSGVGKTKEEIREALQYPGRTRRDPRGILLFNVESEAELDTLLTESARQLTKGAAIPSVSIA